MVKVTTRTPKQRYSHHAFVHVHDLWTSLIKAVDYFGLTELCFCRISPHFVLYNQQQ